MPPFGRRDLLFGSVALGAAGCQPRNKTETPEPTEADAPAEGGFDTSPFLHGVASGDPTSTHVILWTRVTPPPGAENDPIQARLEVSTKPTFKARVYEAEVTAAPERDHTIKVDVPFIRAGATYYYRFVVGGFTSPVGRARTLPAAAGDGIRFGVASCANLPAGYFNAYRALAARTDLAFVLHLGDYLYEFANGTYGDGTALGRVPEPDAEVFDLAGYRKRHAQYKRDPDLQELHRQHPMISVWDDHEFANDAWSGGAENHNADDGEGEWDDRRRAAVQAYLEWMPIREAEIGTPYGQIYRSFRIPGLLDLAMLDTRIIGRDKPLPKDAPKEALEDPERSILGIDQEQWLYAWLRGSGADAIPWRFLGQQVPLAQMFREKGVIMNADKWDGYAANRTRLFDVLEKDKVGDLVVLTGDLHASWGLELARDPNTLGGPEPGPALGVEFVTPGISSPGWAEGAEAEKLLPELTALHPHARYINLDRRGYMVVDVDTERVQGEWWAMETVAEASTAESMLAALQTTRGSNRLVKAEGPSPARPGADPAP